MRHYEEAIAILREFNDYSFYDNHEGDCFICGGGIKYKQGFGDYIAHKGDCPVALTENLLKRISIEEET